MVWYSLWYRTQSRRSLSTCRPDSFGPCLTLLLPFLLVLILVLLLQSMRQYGQKPLPLVLFSTTLSGRLLLQSLRGKPARLGPVSMWMSYPTLRRVSSAGAAGDEACEGAGVPSPQPPPFAAGAVAGVRVAGAVGAAVTEAAVREAAVLEAAVTGAAEGEVALAAAAEAEGVVAAAPSPALAERSAEDGANVLGPTATRAGAPQPPVVAGEETYAVPKRFKLPEPRALAGGPEAVLDANDGREPAPTPSPQPTLPRPPPPTRTVVAVEPAGAISSVPTAAAATAGWAERAP
ncbi:unnamed protein product [Ectocarpus sp. 12 AP-2014]